MYQDLLKDAAADLEKLRDGFGSPETVDMSIILVVRAMLFALREIDSRVDVIARRVDVLERAAGRRQK
jgi:hypothetical protein